MVFHCKVFCINHSRLIHWIFWPSLLAAAVVIGFGEILLSLFGADFVAGHGAGMLTHERLRGGPEPAANETPPSESGGGVWVRLAKEIS